MKKLKLLLLLIAFIVKLQVVITDQINQSRSNLETLEIKTNDKETLLLDKAESKILPNEKNASELDDKKVESILDDITDLSDLSENEKQQILEHVNKEAINGNSNTENTVHQTQDNKTTSTETNEKEETINMVFSTQESPQVRKEEPLTEPLKTTTETTSTEKVKVVAETIVETITEKIHETKQVETTDKTSTSTETVSESTSTETSPAPVLESTTAKKLPEPVSEPIKTDTTTQKQVLESVSEATSTEASKEPILKAVSSETTPGPVSESTTTEKLPEPVSESTSTETSPEPVSESTLNETLEEPVSESTPTEVSHESISKTVLSETIPEPVSESTTTEKLPEPVSESTATKTLEEPVSESTSTETSPEPVSESTADKELSVPLTTEAELVSESSTVETNKEDASEENQTEAVPTVFPIQNENLEKNSDDITKDVNLPPLPSVTSKPHIDSMSRRFSNKIKQLRNAETNKESHDEHNHDHHHDHHDHQHDLYHSHEHDHDHDHGHYHQHDHHGHSHDHEHEHEDEHEHSNEHIHESKDEDIQNNTKHEHRVCANLDNFKQILSENFEPLYLPLVNLLPEDLQLMLLNESFGGISNASIIFLILNLGLVSSLVFLIIRILEGKKINLNSNINDQLILQTNRIKQLEFDLKTYVTIIEDYEQKKSSQETILNDKDLKIRDLNEKLSKSLREQEFNEKEVSKLKANETKLIKENNQLRNDLNSLNEVFTQQKSVYAQTLDEKDQKILELESIVGSTNEKMQEYETQFSDYYQIKEDNGRLVSELAESKNTIELLRTSLSIKNSAKNSDIEDYVQVDEQGEQNLDALLNLAQLQMEFKGLQEKYDLLLKENELKKTEIEEVKSLMAKKEEDAGQFEARIKKFEKQIKENEMQIRLLNELREKDTKQHLKGLSELDMQLKKKTADADKVSHYMEQLRVKQERIQELETNLSRVEKQWNQERQTFEKQSHENWLNAKKLDKELKETKIELNHVKERLKHIETSGSQVQENVIDEPPRPASASSNSGNTLPPNQSGYRPFIPPPPFRYPFPPPPMNPAQAAQAVAFMQQHLEQQRLTSASPNQEAPRMPNIPVPPNPILYQRMLQAQQYMQQQMSNSANSSQQVSPGELSNSNILASTALNDTNDYNTSGNHTNHYMNDTEFDYSSNSGVFNQNENENYNHYGTNDDVNVNGNFNV